MNKRQQKLLETVAKHRERIDAMTDDQRAEELGKLLELDIEIVVKKAALFQHSYENGGDLHKDNPFTGWLLKIAGGQLMPEVFLDYMGDARKLHVIAKMPFEIQELCIGKLPQIKVKVRGDDGKITDRMKHPLYMKNDQFDRVFNKDKCCLYSDAEQIDFLDQMAAEQPIENEDVIEITQNYEVTARGVKFYGPNGVTFFLSWKEYAELGEMRNARTRRKSA